MKANTAFAVVPYRCLEPGKWSLAHELGHLMGARHDFTQVMSEDEPEKPYPYSRGYVYVSQDGTLPRPYFLTLMAKNDACEAVNRRCRRILYWSNPNVSYEGTNIRVGTSETDPPPSDVARTPPSDVARTLNNTAGLVAKFRCSQP